MPTTTTYTFDQLKEDVRKEAEALRQHATKEEVGKLEIDNLLPGFTDQCVYGLMTGNCYSKRAAELISKCATKFFDRLDPIFQNGISGLFESAAKEIKVTFMESRQENSGLFAQHSAIEAYILLPEAENANLIAYLRGETETLEL